MGGWMESGVLAGGVDSDTVYQVRSSNHLIKRGIIEDEERETYGKF